MTRRTLCLYQRSFLIIASSTHILVSKTDDVGLWQLCVGRSIDSSVGIVVFREPDLRLVVDTEVRKLGLSGDSDLATNVCHLKGFLSKVPFVPMVVRLNMFIDEMSGAFDAFVNHEGC